MHEYIDKYTNVYIITYSNTILFKYYPNLQTHVAFDETYIEDQGNGLKYCISEVARLIIFNLDKKNYAFHAKLCTYEMDI